jgi:hypothetical protein
MTTRTYWIAAFFLFAVTSVWANSVPSSELGESGILTPISRKDVSITSERLLITFPTPIRPAAKRAGATVRAEYILRPSKDLNAPTVVDIGFPIAYAGMRDTEYGYGVGSIPRASVRLDGHSVYVRLLTLEDLARPVTDAWRKRVDQNLRKFPDLQKLVMAVRAEGTVHGIYDDGGSVTTWLEKNGGRALREAQDENLVALGLIGVATLDDESRLDKPLQHALAWFDPNYKEINLTEVLSDKWGHRPLLLSDTGELVETDIGVLFGVLQFRVELTPQKKHVLVVEYEQPLGSIGIFEDKHGVESMVQGFRYIMANATKWRDWGTTSIEIRIPKGWGHVATRPRASLVKREHGSGVYRIHMGRPPEALYISVATGLSL